MKKKTVLVTGGAGFIGSHLVDRLVLKNYKVIVLDSLKSGVKKNLSKSFKRITFIKKDIRNFKTYEKYFKKVDLVFHLAAIADVVPSIKNPEEYFYTNVQGTLNVLKACRKHKVKKIVYIASASCYGIAKEIPTSENAHVNTEYPYALTKRLGEELVIHWGKVYKLNFTSVRLFNVYGPRSRTAGAYGAMFGVFLSQKLANKPFTIVGTGNQKRDFTYISDVIDALIIISKSKKSNKEIFNVGSGIPISVNKIAKMIGGKKIYIPKRPGEPEITVANIKKIKKVLRWRPKVNIKTGVKIMLNNISYWKSAPLWTPKKIKKATKDWFKYLK
ncbi:MAG: NAD-dependent dehydratase [Flavobacteriales bacterium]|nr:NAD-dependent dehydratase [Flavobacteriales bacterium]